MPLIKRRWCAADLLQKRIARPLAGATDWALGSAPYFWAGRLLARISVSFLTMHSLKSSSVGDTWRNTCW